MTKYAFTVLLLTMVSVASAQNKDKNKEKKSVKETINQLPDMLIAQPDAGVDTNANKLINDNMYIVINPMWREQGLQTLLDFKLPKTDKEPLSNTFPLPEKKIVQSLGINMATIKKTPEDKKQMALTQIKNHLTAYFKEAGISISAKEITEKANAMIISSEPFTTNQGKTGELYFLHDILTNQSNLVALLLIPGAVAPSTSFVQINYTRFTYETTLPEDPMELKTFVYPDEQQTYMDFTKSILKTLQIR